LPCLTSDTERRYLPGVGLKTVKTRQGLTVDVVRSVEGEKGGVETRRGARLASVKTPKSSNASDGGGELVSIKIRPARFRLLV